MSAETSARRWAPGWLGAIANDVAPSGRMADVVTRSIRASGGASRARAARKALGERAFILGHHYQRDEVIHFADVTGDSFKLVTASARRRPSRTKLIESITLVNMSCMRPAIRSASAAPLPR